jgi:hypothetical protein
MTTYIAHVRRARVNKDEAIRIGVGWQPGSCVPSRGRSTARMQLGVTLVLEYWRWYSREYTHSDDNGGLGRKLVGNIYVHLNARRVLAEAGHRLQRGAKRNRSEGCRGDE